MSDFKLLVKGKSIVGYDGVLPRALVLPQNADYIFPSLFANSDIDNIVLSGEELLSGSESGSESEFRAVCDSSFFNCRKLRYVKLPSDVRVISRMAFCDCFSLRGITLPHKLQVVGEYAFRWCLNLEKINLPDSLTYIHKTAFDECNSLAQIEYGGITYYAQEDFFGQYSNNNSSKIIKLK